MLFSEFFNFFFIAKLAVLNRYQPHIDISISSPEGYGRHTLGHLHAEKVQNAIHRCESSFRCSFCVGNFQEYKEDKAEQRVCELSTFASAHLPESRIELYHINVFILFGTMK